MNGAPVMLIALLFAPLAMAQPERSFGPWYFGLSGGAVQQLSSDLDDSSGDFSVTRWFIQPSVGYAWSRRTSVSLAVGAGESSYKFSDEVSIAGEQPWDRIRDYRVSIPMRFAIGESFSGIVIPSIRSYAEASADLADGRSEGLITGVSWQLGKRLRLGPGFGWFTEIGGGANVFPILVIDWKITERLQLATGRGLAASQGPGLSLNYHINPNWKTGLTVRFEKVRFALDDKGPAAGGFGQDQSTPVLISGEYSPWPMTSISALVGVELNGNLRLEDRRGNLVDRSDYRPAPILGFAFRSLF